MGRLVDAELVKLRRDPVANVVEYLDVNDIPECECWSSMAQTHVDGVTAAVLEARPHDWAEDLSEVSDYLRQSLEAAPGEDRIDKQTLLLLAIRSAAEKAAEYYFDQAQERRIRFMDIYGDADPRDEFGNCL